MNTLIPNGKSAMADELAVRALDGMIASHDFSTISFLPPWEVIDQFNRTVLQKLLGDSADDAGYVAGVTGFRNPVTGDEVYHVVDHDPVLLVSTGGMWFIRSDARLYETNWWKYP